MSKTKQLLQSISLITGTTIGASILGMPIIMADSSIYTNIILLIIVFIFMLIAAIAIAEICIYNNTNKKIEHTNFLSISKIYLSQSWQIVTLISYTCLLYSLISLYLSGFNEITNYWLPNIHPAIKTTITITLLYFAITYAQKTTKIINKILFLSLASTFVLLNLYLANNIDVNNFITTYKISVNILPVFITAFGFQIVIPTIVSICKNEKKIIMKSIYIGCCICLCFYVAFAINIFGVLTQPQLLSLQSNNSIHNLINTLSNENNLQLSFLINTFAILAISTSAFGVTISMFDFLKDINKTNKKANAIITLIPPAITVTIIPNSFLLILGFAGAIVALLLGIIPIIAFKNHVKQTSEKNNFISSKILNISLLFFSSVIGIELYAFFQN